MPPNIRIKAVLDHEYRVQPVIDFPTLIYLDEVGAAYRDYPEQLRLRFDRRDPSPGRHGHDG